MDRFWLLTWSTYGSRLPGDKRGFVSSVRQRFDDHVIHNIPGTPIDEDLPALVRYSRRIMKGEPIRLIRPQARALFEQFQTTAQFREWTIFAVGIMANHVHLVVGVKSDPPPSNILRDFKAYGSGRLNATWGKPESETWWTESGSKRKLPPSDGVLAAVRYVLNQQYPLLIWTSVIPELGLAGGILSEEELSILSSRPQSP